MAEAIPIHSSWIGLNSDLRILSQAEMVIQHFQDTRQVSLWQYSRCSSPEINRIKWVFNRKSSGDLLDESIYIAIKKRLQSRVGVEVAVETLRPTERYMNICRSRAQNSFCMHVGWSRLAAFDIF